MVEINAFLTVNFGGYEKTNVNMQEKIFISLVKRAKLCEDFKNIVAVILKGNEHIEEICKQEKIKYFYSDVSDRQAYIKKGLEKYPCLGFVELDIKSPFVQKDLVSQAVDIFCQFYPEIDLVTNAEQCNFPKGVEVKLFNSQSFLKETKNLIIKKFFYYQDWSDKSLQLSTLNDFEFFEEKLINASGEEKIDCYHFEEMIGLIEA